MFDTPLRRLVALRTRRHARRRAFVMILADNPEPLALGLVFFHRVGNIWAGEKVEGEDMSYRWSFSEAEEAEDQYVGRGRVKHRTPLSH